MDTAVVVPLTWAIGTLVTILLGGVAIVGSIVRFTNMVSADMATLKGEVHTAKEDFADAVKTMREIPVFFHRVSMLEKRLDALDVESPALRADVSALKHAARNASARLDRHSFNIRAVMDKLGMSAVSAAPVVTNLSDPDIR